MEAELVSRILRKSLFSSWTGLVFFQISPPPPSHPSAPPDPQLAEGFSFSCLLTLHRLPIGPFASIPFSRLMALLPLICVREHLDQAPPYGA